MGIGERIRFHGGTYHFTSRTGTALDLINLVVDLSGIYMLGGIANPYELLNVW